LETPNLQLALLQFHEWATIMLRAEASSREPRKDDHLRWVVLALGSLLGLWMGHVVAWSAELNVGILKISGVANAFVAKQQGMFEKNGLDARLVEFTSGANAVNAAHAGTVDVFLSIAGSAMPAIERGFELAAVFQNETGRSKPPDSSSVQVLADSPIKSLVDLAKKKVAVSSLNSQQVIGVQVLLKKAGVDPRSVEFVELPFPAQINALRARQVDAVVPVDPFTTQLLITGGRVISWSYVESIPDQPLGAWFAKRSFISKNPGIIEAFNRTMKESIDYMNADEERARRDVVAFTGLSLDLVKGMPVPHLVYQVRPERWQNVIDMLVEYKVLEKAHKPEDFFAEQIKPYIVN
jgi:NitT/TauT family transport system substrate-binding protein